MLLHKLHVLMYNTFQYNKLSATISDVEFSIDKLITSSNSSVLPLLRNYKLKHYCFYIPDSVFDLVPAADKAKIEAAKKLEITVKKEPDDRNSSKRQTTSRFVI